MIMVVDRVGGGVGMVEDVWVRDPGWLPRMMLPSNGGGWY